MSDEFRVSSNDVDKSVKKMKGEKKEEEISPRAEGGFLNS